MHFTLIASICRQANGLTQRPEATFDAPVRRPLISAHTVGPKMFRLRRRHHLTRRRLSVLDIGGFGSLQGSSFMPDSQPTLGTLFVEAFRTLAPKRADSAGARWSRPQRGASTISDACSNA